MPANVFGKPKKNTDFKVYNGEGFKLSVPAKWNPSKEVEFPGQVLRYEDNFDTTSNLAVTITPTDKKSIKDYGAPEEFLSQVIKSIISRLSIKCFFLDHYSKDLKLDIKNMEFFTSGLETWNRLGLIMILLFSGELSIGEASLLWQNSFRGELPCS